MAPDSLWVGLAMLQTKITKSSGEEFCCVINNCLSELNILLFGEGRPRWCPPRELHLSALSSLLGILVRLGHSVVKTLQQLLRLLVTLLITVRGQQEHTAVL